MREFAVATKKHFELVDLTDTIKKIVSESKIENGILVVYSPHTTAGIVCNENESRLKSDILKAAEALKKNSDFFGGFTHDADEGNAAAHIFISVTGNSRAFIVEKSKLRLGTWQSVMLLEMDGPRNRQVWVEILPNSTF